MVVAVVNTQRRNRARDRAKDCMAWEIVVGQVEPSDEEYAEARARRDDARLKLDEDIKGAYQQFAYLLRTAEGLQVQYKAVPDSKTALSGQDVWNQLVNQSRAVPAGKLSAEYVGQLITAGNFGRNLTPKELFALPFSSPSWPLIATIDDMRQALYELATGSDWMLADSDGNEIRPSAAGQMQPASMQQILRSRPAAPEPEELAGDDSDRPSGGTGRLIDAGDGIAGGGTSGHLLNDSETPTYEITRLRLPVSSLSYDARRTAAWQLVRQLASLLDSATGLDVQMLGLEINVTARTGDTSELRQRAAAVSGLAVTIEADDL